jgi:outer membrane protein, multidrug efflux system
MRTKISILVVAVTVSVQSCKYSEIATNNLRLPESYESTSDTVSAASLEVRRFFKDKRLLELIDTAINQNQDLLAAWQRVESSRATFQFSKAALLPSVNAYTAYNQRKFGLYTMDGAGNITTPIEGEKLVPVHLPDYYAGLQTSWELDLWGKLRGRKAAAMSRFLASVEGKNLVVTNLIAEVAATYYELLALDAELQIIRETLLLQEEALELIKIQKDVGAANQLGVQQFEAQLLSSRAMEKDALQRIVDAEGRMNLLLGRFPQKIHRESNSLFLSTTVDVATGVPSDLLRFRPDIRQSEFNLLAAKADLKTARSAFLPSFNISGSYGFQAYKTKFLFQTPESIAYSLLGGLTAPLINRAAIKAEFRSAKSAELEAMYQYQKNILDAYMEVHMEVFNLRNLEDLFKIKNDEAQLLNQSIETASELFKSRRANYLEIIMAQRNALQSKLELVDVKKRQHLSGISLYKALGGGWQQ